VLDWIPVFSMDYSWIDWSWRRQRVLSLDHWSKKWNGVRGYIQTTTTSKRAKNEEHY